MKDKIEIQKVWNCPRCRNDVTDFPAISRRDNKTEICSACGIEEALFDFASMQEKRWLEE